MRLTEDRVVEGEEPDRRGLESRDAFRGGLLVGKVGVGEGVEGGREEEDGAEEEGAEGKGGGTTEVADLASRKVEIGILRA